MRTPRRVRRAVTLVSVLLLVLLACGACAVRHLHPDTGVAVNRIFDRQARRRAGPPLPATGEEAETALKNYQISSTKSSTKSSAAVSRFRLDR